MTKHVEIDARDQQMLELLASGASSKVMAKKMGYRDGTMRVYLHDLYRKIGVANKTAAAIWHLGRSKTRAAGEERRVESAPAPLTEECFGDFALRENLHAALGAMNMFLGPYGRVWEVATRLKGGAPDAVADSRRRQARKLWDGLLRADVVLAKEFQGVAAERLVAQSPSEATLLVALLLVGGHLRAADRLSAQLVRRKRGEAASTEGERNLLQALRDALEGGGDDALGCLYHLATEKSSSPLLRQIAIVAMFHAYRTRGDTERARDTANALCALAEDARQHLQAMGETPLYRRADLPQPPQATTKGLAAYLKKLGGARLATLEA